MLLATALPHDARALGGGEANGAEAALVVLWRVAMAVAAPGILSGVVVVFAWTMSAFSTPQFIGGGKILMISNLAYLQGFSILNLPFAATLSLIALVAALGSLAIVKSMTGRLERRLAIN